MKTFLLLFILVLSGIVNAQSPWVQDKGKAYIQLGYNMIPNYKTVFGGTMKFRDLPREVTDNTLQFYGEYGIGESHTIIVLAPYKMLETGEALENVNPSLINSSGKLNAFGNLEIGLKRKLLTGNYTFSTQFNIEAPTGTYDAMTGLRTGYDAWTFTPMLSLGRGFEKAYFYLYAGLPIRTNNYDDFVHMGGEIGLKPVNQFTIAFYTDILAKVADGSRVDPYNNQLTIMYVNGQEYYAWGLKGILEIKEKLGFVALFGGAFGGNNVAGQLATNITIYYKI